MTEKQKNFLLKYITEETLNNVDGCDEISSLIGFIIATSKNSMPIFDIRKELHYTSTTSTVQKIHKHLTKHIEQFPGPNDEPYCFDAAFTIPESNTTYYRFIQSWCEGMSEYVTKNYVTVDENCVLVKGVIEYEELAKLGIFDLCSFFKYLQRN